MSKQVNALSADEIRLIAENKYCHFTENHALSELLPQTWDAVFAGSDPAYDKHGLVMMQVPSRNLPIHRTVTLYTDAGDKFILKSGKNNRVEVIQQAKSVIQSEFVNAADPDTDPHLVQVYEAWTRSVCPFPQVPALNIKLGEMREYVREGIESRQQLATQDAGAPAAQP